MTVLKRIIAIGDIHGLDTWKQIVEKHKECHIIFLGDYCDPYNPRQSPCEVLDNLRDIIEYKKNNASHTTLLLGNHDVHYFHKDALKGSRYNSFIAQDIRMLFSENESLFTCAYEENNLLFTHAGVVHDWYLREFSQVIDHVADRLNNPQEYDCNGVARYNCGRMRGGYSMYGGIFWADRSDLAAPLAGYTHIVGHNRVPSITGWATYDQDLDSGVIFCDSLFNGNYLVIECGEDGTHHFYAACVDNDDLTCVDDILNSD